ncbi:MAG: serine/threonine-protein kinase [Planctomycetota bacterium]|nr:serine/threonine-protein kinase [Planctomycetota bacterium]
MSEYDHQHIAEIFLKVSRADPASREELLTEACGNDAGLRAEVESLLKHHDKPDSPLDKPILGDLAGPEDNHPEQIGSYRILRVLGEGGMGIVYLAEQLSPRRTVALKVIRSGLISRQMLRRFEHEAQVLGLLHHPGIAQIFEAGNIGTERAPQPFFAMECIEGPTLTVFTEERELNLNARLALMARICDAVQHAHNKGVIHRDLKPGNILVQEDGQPKILDFGVARATDSDIQMTTMITNVGQLVGTLPYMSPEQVLGDPKEIDMRCDVYALGVLFYELLSGRLPHDLDNKSVADSVRIIRDEEPVTLGSISRIWRGELDTIVGKALEKDKERRYQSPSELAADIRRYLRQEPIFARAPSTMYQFRKLVARHKFPFAAAALLFVIVTTFAIVSTIQAGRLALQRDRALEAEGLATKRFDDVRTLTNSFIFDVHDRINVLPGSTETKRFIVSTALEYLNSLASEAQEDPELLLEIAGGYRRVGEALGGYKLANLGDLEGAKENFQRARDILESLQTNDPDSHEILFELQTLYGSIGGIHYQRKQYEETSALYAQSLALCETLIRDHPEDVSALGAINMIRDKLAMVSQQQGQYEEALAYYESNLLTVKRMQEYAPDLIKAANDEGTALMRCGQLHRRMGHGDLALDFFKRSMTVRQGLVEKEPNNAPALGNLAAILIELGNACLRDDRPEDALIHHQESLTIREKLSASDPYNLLALGQLALAEEHVGGTLSSLGRFDESYEHYLSSLELRERHAEQEPTNLIIRRELTVAYEKMGDTILQRKDFDQAADWYGRSLALRVELVATGDFSSRNARDLAVAHFKMGDVYGAAFAEADPEGDAKKDYLLKAIDAFNQSLDVLSDMEERGALSPSDAGIPDFIHGKITQCEQNLEALNTDSTELSPED